jgi:hypothetical protein
MHSQDQDYAAGSPREIDSPDGRPLPAGDDIVVAEVIDERPGDRQDWHDIQATFVDDPRGAVRRAAEATDTAIGNLAGRLQQMSALTAPAQSPSEQDTEQLRIALQHYRVVWQGIEDLGQRLPARVPGTAMR